jgi:hypothetical protein
MLGGYGGGTQERSSCVEKSVRSFGGAIIRHE